MDWNTENLHRRPVYSRPRLPLEFQHNVISSPQTPNPGPSSRPPPRLSNIHATLRRFRRDPNTPLELQADEIVNTIRQKPELMEATPQSQQRRKEAVRQMTQGLGMKRRVQQKLTDQVLGRKQKRIGCWTRMKYQIREWGSQVRDRFNLNFELWYSTLKRIEGKFGSGYASYFRFFRWLFVFNFFSAVLSLVFVVVPQIIYDVNVSNASWTGSFNFFDIFTGNGYLTDTTLNYGHYANTSIELIGNSSYSIPTAYITVILIVYLLNFIILSASAARSYRRKYIETKGGLRHAYANRVFCGWDYSIATQEAAKLKHSAIFRELKELLSEEKQLLNQQETFCSKFQTVILQLSAHLLILTLNGMIGWGLYALLDKFSNNQNGGNVVITAIVVNLVVLSMPELFTWICEYENYSNPRIRLYISLLRTFLLDGVVLGVILTYFLNKTQNDECWETLLSQEIYRLVIFDFLFAILLTPLFEVMLFFGAKYFRKESKIEFNIAKHSMLLIYNQGLLWAGLLYSPLLPVIVTMKMLILWYLRELTLGWLYGPPKTSWSAGQAQTWFKIITLLTNLLLVMMQAVSITSVQQSKNCGPFQNYNYIYDIIDLNKFTDKNWFLWLLAFIKRPGVVGFIIILIMIGVYYMREVAKIQKLRVELLREMLALQSKDKKYLLDMINSLTGKDYRDKRFSLYGAQKKNGTDNYYQRPSYLQPMDETETVRDGTDYNYTDPQRSSYSSQIYQNESDNYYQTDPGPSYIQPMTRNGTDNNYIDPQTSSYSSQMYQNGNENYYNEQPQEIPANVIIEYQNPTQYNPDQLQETINNIDDIIESRFKKYS